MSISEYLEAIYQNTGGSEAISGVATISTPILLGSFSGVASVNYSISSYIGNYADLTTDNFIVEVTKVPSASLSDWPSSGIDISFGGMTVVKTYDAETGTFTLTRISCTLYGGNSTTVYMQGNIYLVGGTTTT